MVKEENMNPKISVIVPIYNSEKYLAKCIDSILNQTYESIEIILIDDGSSDKSGEICDNYAKNYTQVRVMHTENGGLVRARKHGVSVAQGEYIGFVDSDDWIAPIMYEKLVEYVDKYNVELVGAGVVTSTGNIMSNSLDEGVYSDEGLLSVYSKMMFNFEKNAPGVLQSVCTKLIKKSILEKSMRLIDERITYGEDAAIVYSSCLQCQRIALTNEQYYHYRIHSESMCREKNYQIFDKVYLFSEYMKKVFSMYKEEYQLQRQLKRYTMYFVELGLSTLFSIVINTKYLLPESMVNTNSKILLYGAGNVGKSYYEQLSSSQVVHWIDKGKVGEIINGRQIESISSIESGKYDWVLIAIMQKEVVEQIEKELIAIGVKPSRIIWEKPRVNPYERVIEF